MAQSALDGVDPIAEGLADPLFRRSVTTCPNGQKVGIAAYLGCKVATTKQDEKEHGIFQFGAPLPDLSLCFSRKHADWQNRNL
jgi:hypothetical protein